jgi:hypothetical protein
MNNKTAFNNAAKLNDATYNAYFTRLRQLALSMFVWEGLPDSCDARFLEKTLFTMGRAVFVKDETMGFLTLKVTYGGELNVYELPTQYQAYSLGYSKMFDSDKCVIIRNNYDEMATDFIIALFARRLYEAERTIDVNIKAQKTPVIIRCEEKQRLTMENLYQKYDGNIPFIFGDKALDVDNIKVLKTDAPFITDKLMIYKHDLWNDALTFLGIDNANTDKKERLITDEVESNNQHISMAAETMLKTRQIAAAEINKMFPGLNVTVKIKEFERKETDLDEGKEDEE